MSGLPLPLLVLTGAGISAESGVPTFRDPGGLWETCRLEDLATPEGFREDPTRAWRWYDGRRQRISCCAPNAAHRTLVEIERWAERRNGGFLLVTQNVDGLHEAAGSRNLRRLHGSIWTVRCLGCGRETEDRTPALPELPPRCAACGGLLRPGVVWFGERLDPHVLEESFRAAREARTMIVIGTSSLVYPAAALPEIALDAGVRVIEINPEPTPLSPYVTERCAGPAARELPRWWKRKLEELP